MNVSIGQTMQCKFIKNGVRINEDGTVVPCCTFTGNLGINYTNKFDFDSYLNSTLLAELQQKFEHNIWPDNCITCKEKEALKQVSIRQQGEASINNGLYLDVVVGKECNSDCVMCYSGQSSKIASRIKSKKPTFAVPKEDEYWVNQNNFDDWIESTDFWSNLTKIFPRLETIKFLGGEPLLNKKLWEWLDSKQVAEQKSNKKFILITNASIVEEDKLYVFSNWKRTDIVLSIDAIEQEYEWIRHGLKWPVVKNNVELLQTIPNAYVSVHATISLYSVASIAKLMQWVDDNNLLFSFTQVTSPTLLAVEYAPIPILEKVLSDLSNLEFKNVRNKILTNGIKNTITTAIANNKEDARLRQSITNYFNNHRNHTMDWETLKCMT